MSSESEWIIHPGDVKGVLGRNSRKYIGKETTYIVDGDTVKVEVPGIGVNVIARGRTKKGTMKLAAHYACVELAKRGKLHADRKCIMMDNLEREFSYETEEATRWSFHPGLNFVYRIIYEDVTFEWYSIRKLYCTEFYTRSSHTTDISHTEGGKRVVVRFDRIEYLDAARIAELLKIRAQFYNFGTFIMGSSLPLTELVVPIQENLYLLDATVMNLETLDVGKYIGRICRVGNYMRIVDGEIRKSQITKSTYEYIESSLYKICVRQSGESIPASTIEVFGATRSDIASIKYLLDTTNFIRERTDFLIKVSMLRIPGLVANPADLMIALTPHTNELGDRNNQRLEFLGDAVLELLIRSRFRADQDGEKRKLVCNDHLLAIGSQLLGNFYPNSVSRWAYADAVEAMIATVFIHGMSRGGIDSGIGLADKFVSEIYPGLIVVTDLCLYNEWFGFAVAWFASALHLYLGSSRSEQSLSIGRHLLLEVGARNPNFYLMMAKQYIADPAGCIGVIDRLSEFVKSGLSCLEKITILIKLEDGATTSVRELVNKRLNLGLKSDGMCNMNYVPMLLERLTSDVARDLLDEIL